MHTSSTPPPPTSDPTPPNSLENGTEIRRRVGTSGHGQLAVRNGNTEDAVVVVVNATNSRTIRSFYVQAGKAFTETRIPPGRYSVYFFTGSDWNSTLRSFNRDANYLLFGKELAYEQTRVHKDDGTSIIYDTHNITLNPVAGGDVSSSPADRASVIDSARFASIQDRSYADQGTLAVFSGLVPHRGRQFAKMTTVKRGT